MKEEEGGGRDSLVDADVQTLVGPLPEDQGPELMQRGIKARVKEGREGDGRGEKVSFRARAF